MLCSPNTTAVVECGSHIRAPAISLMRYGPIDSRSRVDIMNRLLNASSFAIDQAVYYVSAPLGCIPEFYSDESVVHWIPTLHVHLPAPYNMMPFGVTAYAVLDGVLY